MHHIINPAKFRKLKQHAIHANISGLVKAGTPGVLVFEGRNIETSSFLKAARRLRYLDFHHLDTRPISTDIPVRLAKSKVGLQEVADMRSLVDALDAMSLKSWFRMQMGMGRGP